MKKTVLAALLALSSSFNARNPETDQIVSLSRIVNTAPSGRPVEKDYSWISSRFGDRIVHDKNGNEFHDSHSGVDFGIEAGSPVRTTAPGVVIYAGNEGSYGNVVKVDHENGYRTVYAHLQDVKVTVGACLRKGKKIGTVGSTGRAYGAHLHYEIQCSNGCEHVPINPEPYLK